MNRLSKHVCVLHSGGLIHLLAAVVPLLMCFPLVLAAGSARTRLPDLVSEDHEDLVRAEIEIGQAVAARILADNALCRDTEATRYVNLVGKAVAEYAGRPELDFTFGILEVQDVNAVSTPGGYVFVTTGALDLMEDEAELACVLAHEIAHVAERHIMKEIGAMPEDDSVTRGLAELIGGAFGTTRAGFTLTVDAVLEILFERGYTTADELEADRDAVILAASSGYDPRALVRFFERAGGSGEQARIVSPLYPPIGDRIDLCAGEIDRQGLSQGTWRSNRREFHRVFRTPVEAEER